MGEAMSADHADHLPTIFSIDGRQSNPSNGRGFRRLPTMPTIFLNKCIRNNNWVLPHHPMWIYVTFWNRWSAGIKNGSNPYAARSVAADHLFKKMVGISGGKPPGVFFCINRRNAPEVQAGSSLKPLREGSANLDVFLVTGLL